MRTARQLELEALSKFTRVETFASVEDPGVLLSDRIQGYVTEFDLIKPFEPSGLKPAAYELRVGQQYAVGGVTRSLSSAIGESELKIEPFEVAIIQTLERINMPNFLIARWNIRVALAYEGLMWVGGAQVDPGYQGYLSCPVYNLSDKVVTLQFGAPLAAIDFVTTTTPKKDISKSYASPEIRSRITFSDYNTRLESALARLAQEKINRFQDELGSIQSKVDAFTAVTFTSIAILVAAVAVVAAKPQATSVPISFWLFTALSSFSALVSFTLILWLKRAELSGRRDSTISPWAQIPLIVSSFFIVLLLSVTALIYSFDHRVESLEEQLQRSISDTQLLRTELSRATKHLHV